MRHVRAVFLILVSLAAARAQAATLTVGPTGTFATVQAAVTHGATLSGRLKSASPAGCSPSGSWCHACAARPPA